MAVENHNRSDDKFWKLFNINLAGIFLSRLPGGEIIEINDSFLATIEYTRKEVIGRTSAEVGWLDVHERQKMVDAFFANKGRLVDYEITISTKSGKKRTALYSATITEFNGEDSVLVTVQDITARKKAEQQIKESEEKFRKLYNISHVGITVSRMPKGEVLDINDTYLNMIGYTRDEVIGRTPSEVGWLDTDERSKMLETLFAKNRLDDYEIGFKTKSGQHGTVLISGVLVELSGESCVLVTVQNITERKKAEQRLRESEEKFRKLYNISRVGISVSRLPRGEIMEINDTYLAMIGYSRDEIIGRVAGDVWLDADACSKMLEAFSVNYILDNYEIDFKTKSGHHGVALFSGVAIELNGEKCGLLTVQDITERKKAEEKIRESEAKFRKVFDISPAGISLVNRNTQHIIEINDTYLKMIEHSREDVIGRTSLEVGWLEPQERQKMIEKGLEYNAELRDYEINFTSASGRSGTALFSAAPIEINREDYVMVTVLDITERKKAEKQIAESEEKFRKLYNISHVGISVSRLPEGEILEINDTYLDMIGYSREEVIGRISSDVGWLNADERRKMHETFFAKNKLDDYEIGFITKSGQHGIALFSGVPVELSGEKCVLVTVHDITERKMAEQKIRESEVKFRKVFDISRVGIALVNRKTQRYIELNDAYLEIIEYSREDVIGRTSLEVGWMDPQERQKMIEKLENDKELRDYEITYTSASGRAGTAVFSATPIEINKEDCLLVTVKDITERKKAEQRIAESEEKFRKLFDMSQAGIVLIHYPSRKFIEINDAYLKLIEYTRKEIVGHTELEVDWLIFSDRQKMINSFYAGNRTIRDYEIGYTKKSGKKGTILISYDWIEINHEKYVLAAVMDITLRLEQEKRKTELVEQLKQANQDLESFSFSVSHDLRAPLRAISGYIEMLQHKHESLSEDEERLIGRIKDQTRKMGNLVEDILAFSRQSNLELSKAPVDMNKLTKGVLDDYASELDGKEIILQDLQPCIGDSHALKQVFVNFITNALKYSAKKEHPVIEIGAYAEGKENIYFVKDNGAGFDMKYYDQLFQVFHRLHTQEDFEGSGVGLAIVNKIISKHGGRVWAQGKVDEGATFFFSLPCE